MPNHHTPQSMRGDAQFDLDAQYDEMGALVAEIGELDSTWKQLVAHTLRRVAGLNQLRHQAVDSLTLADAEQARIDAALAALDRERVGWDGVTERRQMEMAA